MSKFKVIVESKGKAQEYSTYSLNIYNGCIHGCTYPCFNTLRNRSDYHSEVFPIKKLKFDKLKTELGQLKGEEILLSFFSDCYQPIDKKHKLTRQVLQLFLQYGIIPNILTKGQITDWDVIKDFDKIIIGTTITTNVSAEVAIYEPNAIPVRTRLDQLRYAKSLGCNTWISFEPIININSIWGVLLDTIEYVDEVKFGKWNYTNKASIFDWRVIVESIVDFCTEHKIKYTLKDDLKSYIS